MIETHIDYIRFSAEHIGDILAFRVMLNEFIEETGLIYLDKNNYKGNIQEVSKAKRVYEEEKKLFNRMTKQYDDDYFTDEEIKWHDKSSFTTIRKKYKKVKAERNYTDIYKLKTAGAANHIGFVLNTSIKYVEVEVEYRDKDDKPHSYKVNEQKIYDSIKFIGMKKYSKKDKLLYNLLYRLLKYIKNYTIYKSKDYHSNKFTLKLKNIDIARDILIDKDDYLIAAPFNKNPYTYSSSEELKQLYHLLKDTNTNKNLDLIHARQYIKKLAYKTDIVLLEKTDLINKMNTLNNYMLNLHNQECKIIDNIGDNEEVKIQYKSKDRYEKTKKKIEKYEIEIEKIEDIYYKYDRLQSVTEQELNYINEIVDSRNKYKKIVKRLKKLKIKYERYYKKNEIKKILNIDNSKSRELNEVIETNEINIYYKQNIEKQITSILRKIKEENVIEEIKREEILFDNIRKFKFIDKTDTIDLTPIELQLNKKNEVEKIEKVEKVEKIKSRENILYIQELIEKNEVIKIEKAISVDIENNELIISNIIRLKYNELEKLRKELYKKYKDNNAVDIVIEKYRDRANYHIKDVNREIDYFIQDIIELFNNRKNLTINEFNRYWNILIKELTEDLVTIPIEIIKKVTLNPIVNIIECIKLRNKIKKKKIDKNKKNKNELLLRILSEYQKRELFDTKINIKEFIKEIVQLLKEEKAIELKYKNNKQRAYYYNKTAKESLKHNSNVNIMRFEVSLNIDNKEDLKKQIIRKISRYRMIYIDKIELDKIKSKKVKYRLNLLKNKDIKDKNIIPPRKKVKSSSNKERYIDLKNEQLRYGNIIYDSDIEMLDKLDINYRYITLNIKPIEYILDFFGNKLDYISKEDAYLLEEWGNKIVKQDEQIIQAIKESNRYWLGNSEKVQKKIRKTELIKPFAKRAPGSQLGYVEWYEHYSYKTIIKILKYYNYKDEDIKNIETKEIIEILYKYLKEDIKQVSDSTIIKWIRKLKYMIENRIITHSKNIYKLKNHRKDSETYIITSTKNKTTIKLYGHNIIMQNNMFFFLNNLKNFYITEETGEQNQYESLFKFIHDNYNSIYSKEEMINIIFEPLYRLYKQSKALDKHNSTRKAPYRVDMSKVILDKNSPYNII